MKSLLSLLVVCFSFVLNAQNLIPYCKNGKYGFCDLQGKLVIQPSYEQVKLFRQNRSVVKKDSKFFLIDEKGNLKSGQYDDLRETESGLYIASENNLYGIVGRNGEVKLAINYSSIDMNVFSVVTGISAGKSILFDRNLNKVLESDTMIIADEIDEDSIVVVSYKKGNKYLCSIYTSSFQRVVGPVEDNLLVTALDYTGLFTVELKDKDNESTLKAGLINREGKWLIPFQLANERPQLYYTGDYNSDDLLEKLGKEYYINKDAYEKFLSANYSTIGYSDSSFKYFNLSGKELFIYKKTKAGSELNFQNTTVKTGGRLESPDGLAITREGTVLLYLAEAGAEDGFFYCVNKDGKLLNKKPWNDITYDEGLSAKYNIIVYETDSLLGVIRSNGTELIPPVLKDIYEDGDKLVLKDNANRMAFVRPDAEFKFSSVSFYNNIFGKSGGFYITQQKIGNKDLFGLLDKNTLHQISLPVYVATDYVDNTILCTKQDGSADLYCAGNGMFTITAEQKLQACINFAKKQFIFKTKDGFVFQNGEQAELFYKGNVGDAFIINHHWLNGVYGFGLVIDDKISTYQIINNKVEEKMSLAAYNEMPELASAFSLKNESSLTNIVMASGKEIVPYNNWTVLGEWKANNDLMSNPVYFARNEKEGYVYNCNGDKIYSCSSCDLYGTEVNLEMVPVVVATGFSGRSWMLIYSDVSKKLINVPFNENYEYINDSCYFFTDTLKNAYLFFGKQSRLLKVPFNATEMFVNDMEDHFVINIRDNSGNWHVYNPKTDEFKKIPGYIRDFGPVHETWKNGRHQYFYYYADSGLTKMGVINEQGSIIAKAEYSSIEMLNDNDSAAIFVCRNEKQTDFALLNGRLIRGDKNYSSVYEEGFPLCFAEYRDSLRTRFHLYNESNGFKKINYTFTGATPYLSAYEIGGKWLIGFEKYMYEKIFENGESYEADKVYTLFVDENGKEFFEFNENFRPIEE